jgi:hypothetical protein
VLTVSSAAFPDRPVTLNPVPALTLVGIYAEDVSPVRFDPLPSDSAKGSLRPRAEPAAAPPRRSNLALVFGVALFVLAVLVVMKLSAG